MLLFSCSASCRLLVDVVVIPLLKETRWRASCEEVEDVSWAVVWSRKKVAVFTSKTNCCGSHACELMMCL